MNASTPNNPFIEAGKRALEEYKFATYARAFRGLKDDIIQAGWNAYCDSLIDGTAFNNKEVKKSFSEACKSHFKKASRTLAKNPKAALGTAALSLAGLAYKNGLLFSYDSKNNKNKKPVQSYEQVVKRLAMGR